MCMIIIAIKVLVTDTSCTFVYKSGALGFPMLRELSMLDWVGNKKELREGVEEQKWCGVSDEIFGVFVPFKAN